MIVVGLTGNLASGKSEVARLFRGLGAEVFDADDSARRAVRRGSPAYRAILKIWGPEFLGRDRQLDRRKFAKHVFSRPRDVKKLNILIHPGVIFDSLKKIRKHRSQKGILVLDVPLLFESRMERLADVTVVVRSPMAKMLARAEERGIPRELARKILATQWPASKKARLADYVIDNDGSRVSLRKKVKEVFESIKRGHDSQF